MKDFGSPEVHFFNMFHWSKKQLLLLDLSEDISPLIQKVLSVFTDWLEGTGL